METETISDRKPKSSKSSTIVLPENVWSLNQARSLNPQVSRGTVYNYVKFLQKNNKVTVVGVTRKGRGKPAFQYQLIDVNTAPDPIQAVNPEHPPDMPF